MASATLREIFANPDARAPTTHRSLPTPLSVAPALDEYAWMDDDPDLAPFLGQTTWKPRKEIPLESFL